MNILDSLILMLAEMAPYILLGFLIAGVIHAFVPQSLMSRHLSGSGWRSVFKAAMVGVPLPLCSCGVLPTAIGMRRSGASRAATTSFLVATPQTGADSIAATWSMLGPAFAVVRPIAALSTALAGGVAVGSVERESDDASATDMVCDAPAADSRPEGFGRRLIAALRYGFVDLVGSIGVWLIAGLVIAALITVYVPEGFFGMLGTTPLLSMILVLVVAVPMYVCATGSIPIAMSLMLKGLSPGTALVLLMAGPAANFASFALIRRELGTRSAWVYLGSIVIGALAFGLAIDYLLPKSWFVLPGATAMAHDCCAPQIPLFDGICAGLLGALLIYSLVRRIIKHKINPAEMNKEYTVKGMNCPHCQATVQRAIASVTGVEDVAVDLAGGRAQVKGEHDPQQVIEAVSKAGFDICPA